MSVIYEKLKQVEETQPEVKTSGKKEQQTLPMEEEIQRQNQKKTGKKKRIWIMGAAICLIGVIIVAAFVSIENKNINKLVVQSPINRIVSKQKNTRKKITGSTLKAKNTPKSTDKKESTFPVADKIAESNKTKATEKTPATDRPKGQTGKAADASPTKDGMDIAQKNKNGAKTKNKVLRSTSAEKTPAKPALKKPEEQLSPIQIGEQYYKAGKMDKAIKVYKEIIEKEPTKLEAYNNIGVVYARKGWTKSAVENLMKAIDKNPYYAEAHFNLAVLMEKKGQNTNAMRHYLKFVEYAQPKDQDKIDLVKKHLDID